MGGQERNAGWLGIEMVDGWMVGKMDAEWLDINGYMTRWSGEDCRMGGY